MTPTTYITVRDLLAALAGAAPEAVVILAHDSEGNSFSPCAAIDDESAYEPETRWSGEVKITRLTPEMEREGFTEDDVASDGALPCVVLWPTN